MPNTLHLDEFQRWMLAVVTNFGDDTTAWNSAEATAEMPHERALQNVLPSPTLNQYERIGIYRRMYYLRMRDALEIDVPSVHHAIGREQFEELVEQYFTRYPSHSYTLNDTGLMLPTFLRESSLPNKEFLAQLAELELAVSRVMDAPETPALTAAEIAAIPPDAWERARFTPVAALEVHAFTYPVHEYLCAVEDESPTSTSFAPAANYVLIHRSEFRTKHTALDAAEYDLLSALIARVPLGEAFETVQKHFGDNPDDAEQAQQRISSRFQEWMTSGVFTAVLV